MRPDQELDRLRSKLSSRSELGRVRKCINMNSGTMQNTSSGKLSTILEKSFLKYNSKYFENILDFKYISWSERMTLCTGKTYLKKFGNNRYCQITLSKPLLSQRPHLDTINTMLHEMIHGYLYVSKGIGQRDSHGKPFRKMMNKINEQEGTKITIRHKFHKEVNKFRVHIYKCNGRCRFKQPFYGILKRAVNRPPGPNDDWWENHQNECGGTFIKEKMKDSANQNSTDESCSSFTVKTNQTRKNERVGNFKDISANSKVDYVFGNVNCNYRFSIQKHAATMNKYVQKYFGNVTTPSCNKIDEKICNKKFNIQKYLSKFTEASESTSRNGLLQPEPSYSGIIKRKSSLKNTEMNDPKCNIISCPNCKREVMASEITYHLSFCL